MLTSELLLIVNFVCRLPLIFKREKNFFTYLILKHKCTSRLFGHSQVAIGRRLGIEEPQIMKIMRATLYTHNEWFKLQMCKDPFEGLLRIGSLKDVSSPLLTDAATKSNADTCTHGSSQVTISSSSRMQEDGSSPTQVSSTEVICDENAILKVMVSSSHILES